MARLAPTISADVTTARAGTVHVRETHAVADFAVGRDVGIGSGPAQVKLGLRYADLSARISGPGVAYLDGRRVADIDDNAYLKSRFQGLGPRVAVEGSMPLSGQFGLDYGVGAAYLFSISRDRTFSVEDSSDKITQSDKKGVFNTDASLAVTYNFTPTTKVALGYRADVYFNALPGIDFTTSGGKSDSTRIYHGAFLRLTSAF